MKLNNTQIVKRKSGMTLLELTVVILVLLSLISILFVGARAWKKGSDRSACIINIRNVQQAVRGYMNMNQQRAVPDDAEWATIIFASDTNTDGYLKEPICPSDPARTFTTSYTPSWPTTMASELGTIFLTCNIVPDDGAESAPHAPDNTDDW
jgi:prepilin-type N-terminal cleavage/methylation domain-containing protein